jgi:putative ABC transport system ATP-binding protein
MARVRIEELTIQYAQGGYVVRPIDGLSVTAEDGELVLLLGPSGSGKTTLLSCLAGILQPASGRIYVEETAGPGGGAEETEVTGLQGQALAEYRRHRVGIVFQAFNLVPSLTGRDNVAIPLRLAGIGRRPARERAEELLRLVGMEDRMSHLPGAMSGGQQQRVAIARALVHDPPLIVADEPTAHLDYVQVETILRLVRELARPGRLVIVATHDERFAPIADRVVELVPKMAKVQRGVERISLSPGEVLFEQGSMGYQVYVVEEGGVEVYRTGPDGSDHVVGSFGPGDYFGELGPLAGLPRSASARARDAGPESRPEGAETKLTAYGAQEFRRWQAAQLRDRAEAQDTGGEKSMEGSRD